MKQSVLGASAETDDRFEFRVLYLEFVSEDDGDGRSFACVKPSFKTFYDHVRMCLCKTDS